MDKNLYVHYAKSLFEYSKENSLTEIIKDDMDYINTVLKKNLDFAKFLSNPSISLKDKTDKINIIFSKDINSITLHYLSIMVKKNVFAHFDYLYSSFMHLYNEDKGILEGKLYTSFNLDTTKIKQIESLLSKKEKRDVVLTQINDPHILGGIRIYLDNKVYDFTLEKKINDIKESLLSNK